MKVTEIRVIAGRTFNHPHESYSNLRPEVALTATLDNGEDPDAAAKALQAKAESLVEDHKQHLLDSLEQIEQLRLREREVSSLERQITAAQHRLQQLREHDNNLPAGLDAYAGEVAP